MNLGKWSGSLASVRGWYGCKEQWGPFQADFMALEEDAFREELWTFRGIKRSVNNDDKLCRRHRSTSACARHDRGWAAVRYNNKEKG